MCIPCKTGENQLLKLLPRNRSATLEFARDSRQPQSGFLTACKKSRFQDGGGTMWPLTMIYSCSATPGCCPSALLCLGGRRKLLAGLGTSAGHRPGPPQAATKLLTSIQRRRRRKHEIGDPFGWARSSPHHWCLGWLHGEKCFPFTHILL